MNLSLSNSIILFDEAHNLADICRASSSLKLSQTALAATSQEIIRLLSSDRVQPDIKPHYQLLHKAVSGIGSWLLTVSSKLTPKDFEREANTWTGEQALGILGYEADITAATVSELQSAVEAVAKEQEPDDNDIAAADDERQQRKATLSPPALTLVSQLVNVAVFMLGKESTNTQHYKMVVLRERESNTNSSDNNSNGSGSSSGRGRRGGRGGRFSGGRFGGPRGNANGYSRYGDDDYATAKMETYLCLWCLSASVCFQDIAERARSVILTSGTLSPMDSFASELGVPFSIQLEAGHVINVKKQCFVGSVGQCDSFSLNASFQNQGLLEYQDAIGHAIVKYSTVVRGGILVFFPSYSLLDKVRSRWRVTGMLNKMKEGKALLEEPRGSTGMYIKNLFRMRYSQHYYILSLLFCNVSHAAVVCSCVSLVSHAVLVCSIVCTS
jgi:fanconi anemia group J protein